MAWVALSPCLSQTTPNRQAHDASLKARRVLYPGERAGLPGLRCDRAAAPRGAGRLAGGSRRSGESVVACTAAAGPPRRVWKRRGSESRGSPARPAARSSSPAGARKSDLPSRGPRGGSSPARRATAGRGSRASTRRCSTPVRRPPRSRRQWLPVDADGALRLDGAAGSGRPRCGARGGDGGEQRSRHRQRPRGDRGRVPRGRGVWRCTPMPWPATRDVATWPRRR